MTHVAKDKLQVWRLAPSVKTYEPLGRHLKQPVDGIQNTNRQTNVHKNTYNKIQEKEAWYFFR